MRLVQRADITTVWEANVRKLVAQRPSTVTRQRETVASGGLRGRTTQTTVAFTARIESFRHLQVKSNFDEKGISSDQAYLMLAVDIDLDIKAGDYIVRGENRYRIDSIHKQGAVTEANMSLLQ